jgi:DnaK suppressor protein
LNLSLEPHSFQAQLLGLRATLLAQISEQRGGVLSRAEVAADHFSNVQDSHAQTTTQRDLEFALNERETAELEAIDAALKRLVAGTYGVCADCSEPIAKARLLATPEVTRCIACQEKSEHLSH